MANPVEEFRDMSHYPKEVELTDYSDIKPRELTFEYQRAIVAVAFREMRKEALIFTKLGGDFTPAEESACEEIAEHLKKYHQAVWAEGLRGHGITELAREALIAPGKFLRSHPNFCIENYNINHV